MSIKSDLDWEREESMNRKKTEIGGETVFSVLDEGNPPKAKGGELLNKKRWGDARNGKQRSILAQIQFILKKIEG